MFTKLFIKLSCLKYDPGSLVTDEKHEVNSTRAESYALFIPVFVMRSLDREISGTARDRTLDLETIQQSF